MTIKKQLPLGFSNLRDIIESDCLYIDKTKELYNIIASKIKYNLLTRPRRFGKSLIISTLEQIFLGNKELFKDLWIGRESNYEWKSYPVIRLDLSSINTGSTKDLQVGIHKDLDRIARQYNVSISAEDAIDLQFKDLILMLSAQHGQVVLLIDEYDYPLTAQLKNFTQMEENAKVLRAFYTVLKSLNEHIRFMFITGVSKYPQESIFSGLNNVTDISFLPKYASLAGYTQEEIEKYLLPYVDEIATDREVTHNVILNDMRAWYNGHRFSSSPISVYNPFSILNYLHSKMLKNYWFMSGTPTFLVDLLRANKYTQEDLDRALTKPTSLEVFSMTKPSLDVLLYQTGYLTIQSVMTGVIGSELFYIGYPNYEVRTSMHQNLLALFTNLAQNEIVGTAALLNNALLNNDVNDFVLHLQSLLASIPYDLQMEKESYYHSLFHIIGNVLGVDTQSEVHTSAGRIDVVLQTKESVFVIELKCKKPAVVALAQIKEQRYYEKFMSSGKKIFLVGLAFNFPKKKLSVDWISEEFKQQE